MKLHLSSNLKGSVQLPSSKSISNRVLVLNYLSGSTTNIIGLSDADDVVVMQSALQQLSLFNQALPTDIIDIHGAGTAMRFLTAVFSLKGDHILTGSVRMCNRPISVLVNALRFLGANIEYVEKDGFPPLHICGRTIKGGSLEIAADISSQYISALLMIGPLFSQGLHLHLLGELASRPYINMTLALMEAFGATIHLHNERNIEIMPSSYTSLDHIEIEADWSAASYWYEMVALCPTPTAEIFLPRLKLDSLQGDCCVSEFFEQLGVITECKPNGILLKKKASVVKKFICDLTNAPDLAQTLVATCALKGIPFEIYGVESLRIKETDRIAALIAEFEKLGINLTSSRRDKKEMIAGDGKLPIEPYHYEKSVRLKTYDDHRMAMSMAPAAYLYSNLTVENPDVVIKSYPTFWKDFNSFSN